MTYKSPVISLFFLGTSHHRETNEDILTVYHDAAIKGGVHARLFDGVGSNPTVLAATHPTPGRYIYNALTDVKIKAPAKMLAKIDDLMQRLTGCIAGEGIEELLFEAIFYIENILQQNKEVMPDAINLHGFSRGADTCLRLANLLDSLYPDLKINLFLIDQVPGPGRYNDPASYTVPANVQQLHSTFMLHEYKPGFDPQDKTRYVFANPLTTQVTVQVYAGPHGKAMRLSENSKTNHSATLLHDDFFHFAKETGTLPANATIPYYKRKLNTKQYDNVPATILDAKARFELYNEMLQNWGAYAQGTVLSKRRLLNEHGQYSEDPRLFVNQEHGDLFKQQYPALYRWFMLNNALPAVTVTEVHSQLNQLAKIKPFYERFCTVFSLNGNELTEPCQAVIPYLPPRGKVLVNDELSYLRHALTSIANYESHHKRENSNAVKIILDAINNSLAEPNSGVAIERLRAVISKLTQDLGVAGEKTYLYQQLSKLSMDANTLAKQALIILEKFDASNTEIHFDQIKHLHNVRKKIVEINGNSTLNNLEKTKEIKIIISETVLYLKNPLDDNVVIHGIFSPALHYFDPRERLSLNKLIKALNELNAPGFGEVSLAKDIAKRMDAYQKRNLFWNTIKEILLSIIPIKLPSFVSTQKAAIAQQLSDDLNSLEEEGQGNDIKEISKLLAKGQEKLQIIYKERQSLSRGDLDKVIEKSQGRLQAEIKEFSATDSLVRPA